VCLVDYHEYINAVIVKTLSTDDRLAWIRQIREMHSFYEMKENLYWTYLIKSNYVDMKKLWTSMSSVLRRVGATTVPPSSDVTAAKLAQFFTTKVSGVRAATQNARRHLTVFTVDHC
jgi:hypothetical protein